jgi:serine/threonine protein kinase
VPDSKDLQSGSGDFTFGFHAQKRKGNNYLLTAKIGSGSSSTVYVATNTNTNRQVAVKRIKLRELSRRDNGLGQLERDVRLIRRFNHPNILKLIEVLHDDLNAQMYVILEYAANGSLIGYVTRNQPLSRDAIFGILPQIAFALKSVHGLGYVHQDIKPGNVIIDANSRSILADFGIAHSFASAGWSSGRPPSGRRRRSTTTTKRVCRRRRTYGRSG